MTSNYLDGEDGIVTLSSTAHRVLGVAWVSAMVVVCASSFGIHDGRFSWLHALATWTLLCMVLAIAGIRRRNVPVHRGFMIGSYIGTLAAFAFAALIPARLIPRLLAEEPVIAIGTVLGVLLIVLTFHLTVVRVAGRPSAAIPSRSAGAPAS